MAVIWAGRYVEAARKYWLGRIIAAEEEGSPLICSKGCNRPVLRWQQWDVDHLLAREEGGPVLDPTNQWPAHSNCNRADGARRTNSKRGRIRRWL